MLMGCIEGLDDSVLLVLLCATLLTCVAAQSAVWLVLAIVRRIRLGHSQDIPASSAGASDDPSTIEPYNSECPICLARIDNRVMSNCGHAMCGMCFQAMITTTPGIQSCPICRNRITLLMGDTSSMPTEIAEDVRVYNQRYSRVPRSMLEQIRDAPTIIAERLRDLSASQRVILLIQARIAWTFISVFIYIISPLDIIPELIIGPFGIVDDLLVIVLGLTVLGNNLRHMEQPINS